MTATLTRRIIVPSVALVAACGAAFAFGITHLRRSPPVETSAATAAPTVSSPAPSAPDQNSAALAAAQAEASAVASELAVPPRSPVIGDSAPAFDIARIERTGEAVIAGRAAPGAMVELMRNGERLDGAVADASGQFVMVSPRLPSGDYELTLRSRLPDGTLATSKQGVVVALAEAESSSGAKPSRAEVPFHRPDTAATNPLSSDRDSRSSQARLLSQPPKASRQDVAVSELPRATASALLSGGDSTASLGEPKIATTIVSRGDSLWRISRLAYGAGMRYAVVYNANRERIRDPDRIYPGQIFVLPRKAR